MKRTPRGSAVALGQFLQQLPSRRRGATL